jgi:protein-S-isoprenylcysteine O-methyltransferase Ste14
MPRHFYITILVINGMWIPWLIYWAISARFTKKTAYRPAWPQGKVVVICLIAAIILMQNIPGVRYRLIPIEAAVPTEILGMIFCGGGLAFAIWARIYLGRNWSGLVTLKEQHELITAGPYALVRHPIYTGVLTAVIGTALALSPSIGGLFAIPLAAVALTFKLRHEEQLMMREFPEQYAAYRARVRAAIVPFVI